MDLHRDGVFGVPYFINGSEPYWGLDRVPAFVASFGDAAAAVPAAAPAEKELAVVGAGRTTDMSHAGGCG